MKMNSCNCHDCQHHLCVSTVSIFSTLTTDELSKVVELIVHREYAKGEIIQMEGDPIQNLVAIREGQVKAFRNTREGKEQILYIFSAGDFFGEKNLLRHGKATYSVETLVDTQVCLIGKQDFQNLLREYPEISLKIIEELCNRLEHLEVAVENIGAKDPDSRINAVLLEFASRYGTPTSQGILIDLPFSRQEIANYVGLTRETVSRKFNILQADGIIKIIGHKKIIILDYEALKLNIGA